MHVNDRIRQRWEESSFALRRQTCESQTKKIKAKRDVRDAFRPRSASMPGRLRERAAGEQYSQETPFSRAGTRLGLYTNSICLNFASRFSLIKNHPQRGSFISATFLSSGHSICSLTCTGRRCIPPYFATKIAPNCCSDSKWAQQLHTHTHTHTHTRTHTQAGEGERSDTLKILLVNVLVSVSLSPRSAILSQRSRVKNISILCKQNLSEIVWGKYNC